MFTERSLHFAYQMLARSPRTSDQAAHMCIPDTLYYQHGSLRLWYFTDDSGEVAKRDKRECTKERILAVFSEGNAVSSAAPIAVYLHYADASLQHASKEDSFSGDVEPISVEYFDYDGLSLFLSTRENKHEVLVQKFVRGNSQNHSTIQVVWSPHKTILFQRQNIHGIDDERVPLYDRCNTLENTTHLSREMRTTPQVTQRLGAECARLADHVFSVEQRQVLRIVCYFCFSRAQKPVFLWASEMQLTKNPTLAADLRRCVEAQVKRNLLHLSPAVVASDVYVPCTANRKGQEAFSVQRVSRPMTSFLRAPYTETTFLIPAVHVKRPGSSFASQQPTEWRIAGSASNLRRRPRKTLASPSAFDVRGVSSRGVDAEFQLELLEATHHGMTGTHRDRSPSKNEPSLQSTSKSASVDSRMRTNRMKYCGGGGGGFFVDRCLARKSTPDPTASVDQESDSNVASLNLSPVHPTTACGGVRVPQQDQEPSTFKVRVQLLPAQVEHASMTLSLR